MTSNDLPSKQQPQPQPQPDRPRTPPFYFPNSTGTDSDVDDIDITDYKPHPQSIENEPPHGDSWHDQRDVEQRVLSLLHPPHSCSSSLPLLLRNVHGRWLRWNLLRISRGFSAYDALQPWIIYWIVHALNVLRIELAEDIIIDTVSRIDGMWCTQTGGYTGGGSGSYGRSVAHVASTYAAVMALVSLGEHGIHSLEQRREDILKFLQNRKQHDGSVRVSEYGECDVRGLYCLLAVESLLLTRSEHENDKKKIETYIKSLISYDGGIAGEVGGEGHGGNTFCGLAAAKIINVKWTHEEKERFIDWMAMKQMCVEGGFQGRTNKLVDSCYSFWVGSLFPMFENQNDDHEHDDDLKTSFDAQSLANYVLSCCQLQNGGFRDKPGTQRDCMHTCYALCGLSVAQHYAGVHIPVKEDGGEESGERKEDMNMKEKGLCEIDVVYNVTVDKLASARERFKSKS